MTTDISQHFTELHVHIKYNDTYKINEHISFMLYLHIRYYK